MNGWQQLQRPNHQAFDNGLRSQCFALNAVSKQPFRFILRRDAQCTVVLASWPVARRMGKRLRDEPRLLSLLEMIGNTRHYHYLPKELRAFQH
jgi:hypothetical protein